MPEGEGGFRQLPADHQPVRHRAGGLRHRRRGRRAPRSCSSRSSASTSSRPPPRRRRTRSGTSRSASSARWPIVTVLYIAVSLVVTGIQNYTRHRSQRRRTAGDGVRRRRRRVDGRPDLGRRLHRPDRGRDDPDARPEPGRVRDGSRRPAAAVDRQGAPDVRHAVPDHADHRCRRRGDRRASSTSTHAGRPGQHRHPVRVRPGQHRRRRSCAVRRPDLPRAFRTPFAAAGGDPRRPSCAST